MQPYSDYSRSETPTVESLKNWLNEEETASINNATSEEHKTFLTDAFNDLKNKLNPENSHGSPVESRVTSLKEDLEGEVATLQDQWTMFSAEMNARHGVVVPTPKHSTDEIKVHNQRTLHSNLAVDIITPSISLSRSPCLKRLENDKQWNNEKEQIDKKLKESVKKFKRKTLGLSVGLAVVTAPLLVAVGGIFLAGGVAGAIALYMLIEYLFVDKVIINKGPIGAIRKKLAKPIINYSNQKKIIEAHHISVQNSKKILNAIDLIESLQKGKQQSFADNKTINQLIDSNIISKVEGSKLLALPRNHENRVSLWTNIMAFPINSKNIRSKIIDIPKAFDDLVDIG